jgi:hypothetical protein
MVFHFDFDFDFERNAHKISNIRIDLVLITKESIFN